MFDFVENKLRSHLLRKSSVFWYIDGVINVIDELG